MLSELAVYDNYFENEHIFNVDGKYVVVSGDVLAHALNNLPADIRNIILLPNLQRLTRRRKWHSHHFIRSGIKGFKIDCRYL